MVRDVASYHRALTALVGKYRFALVDIRADWCAVFQQITRSRTLSMVVTGHDEMLGVARALLTDLFPVTKGIRLLGVTLSSLESLGGTSAAPQLALFSGQD
nr:hypothetical protein [Aquamicrobium sp. NLF2-7]